MTEYKLMGGGVTRHADITWLDGWDDVNDQFNLVPLRPHLPFAARQLHDKYGVVVTPHFRDTAYADVEAYMTRIRAMGARTVRGMHAQPSADRMYAACKMLGLRWIATIFPAKDLLSFTDKALIRKLEELRAHADVIIAVEGPNEPNGEGFGPAKIKRTVEVQRIIYEFCKSNPELSHVKVLSPAMHAGVSHSVEDHYALRDAGIVDYFDDAALHRYHGGQNIQMGQLTERLDVIEDAWSCKRVWVTETGYSTIAGPGGVPESVQRGYAVRNILQFVRDDRVQMVCQYAALDRVDMRPTEVQRYYGLWRTPDPLDSGTWEPKPVVQRLHQFLRAVWDTDTTYAPAPISLNIDAPEGVQWELLGRSDGSALFVAWQEEELYSQRTDQLTPVAEKIVTVHSASAEAELHVGGEAIWHRFRA